MGEGTHPNTLQTTTTSLEIVEKTMELDGAGVTEIADELDLSPSTVHAHLATLRAREFVIKEGDVYQLGPEFLRLGHYVHTRKDGYVLAEPYTRDLSDRTGQRAVFATEQGGRGIFLHTCPGSQAEWQHETIGRRLYLHNTAIGKAILARLPEWRVEAILDDWGLPRETENTITDREELFAELERIEDQGYAINRGENIPNLWAIGVAAQDRDGSVIGAFSTLGPRRIFADDATREELVQECLRLVEEYELELSLS